MPSTSYKAFVFKKVPHGFPVPGQDIVTETREIDLDTVPEGGLILKGLHASFDPYMRGRMRDPSIKSYFPGLTLDAPITAHVVGKVLKSDAAGFAAGDLVRAFTDIAEYARVPAQALAAVEKLHNPFGLEAGLFVGQLGMPGLTAWGSLYEIGKPKKGETIFISSAAGAVGMVVGQIAKKEGLRVIGSVGSDEKADFIVKELGFDAATNYKKESTADALNRLAPDGIDIYYENVGGEMLEASINKMNNYGRIIACGMISQYNVKDGNYYGVKNLMEVVSKRITLRGFIQSDPDIGPKYNEEHQEQMQKWLHDGTFKAKLSVTDGLDNAPEGFLGMLQGKNFGKALLKIADN